jgi:hypothetical protein
MISVGEQPWKRTNSFDMTCEERAQGWVVGTRGADLEMSARNSRREKPDAARGGAGFLEMCIRDG